MISCIRNYYIAYPLCEDVGFYMDYRTNEIYNRRSSVESIES